MTFSLYNGTWREGLKNRLTTPSQVQYRAVFINQDPDWCLHCSSRLPRTRGALLAADAVMMGTTVLVVAVLAGHASADMATATPATTWAYDDVSTTEPRTESVTHTNTYETTEGDIITATQVHTRVTEC